MISFLHLTEPDDDARQLFAEDIEEIGFVMNVSRLWAYHPPAITALFELMRQTTPLHQLTMRERMVLVAASMSTFGDSSCSLAWGGKLAGETDADTAAAVLRGDDTGLTPDEQALARWARTVARNPNGTSARDVEALRAAGFTDARIFAITVFVGLRLAFATINDALGLLPDAEFRTLVPAAVRDAVTFGRPIADD